MEDLAVIASDIIDLLFAVGPHIRYVAVRDEQELRLVSREGLQDASSPESDRYEELLVNPTLLTLTRQRGDIDCGGLDFVVVGYGNFRQLVIPTPTGHVSVAMENDAVSVAGFDEILRVITTAMR
jgi:hypothetical protein